MKRALALLLLLSLNTALFSQNNFNYYYNMAQDKYVKGNFNEAIKDYNSALRNKADVRNEYNIANAYMGLALCKMKLQNYTSAIEDISQALKLKPEYSDLYYASSRIRLAAKKYDDCISWADKGLALKPEFEELILTKARAKVLKKDYADALGDIDTVLVRINPRNQLAWNLRGEVKMSQKDYKAGAEAFSKAIEMNAQDFAAFYSRGICRAKQNDLDGALSDINRGMEIDSTAKWVGYNNIAFFIKFEQKDYQGSLALFDQAIKMNPQFAYAYNNRGYAKLQMNDLKGAREDITKSMSIDSENAYAYKTYAQLLLAEKKDKQACEKLKKALELGYTDQYDDEVNQLLKEHCK